MVVPRGGVCGGGGCWVVVWAGVGRSRSARVTAGGFPIGDRDKPCKKQWKQKPTGLSVHILQVELKSFLTTGRLHPPSPDPASHSHHPQQWLSAFNSRDSSISRSGARDELKHLYLGSF